MTLLRKLTPHLALAALVWSGSACRSAPTRPEGSRLPFHVALIPTEVHDTSVLTDTPSEPVYADAADEASQDDMRLELTTAAVSEALCHELESAFVRTTLLELPADPAALEGLGAAEREQYWQERAREAGADLLVRTRLLIDPAIDGERNEKFWLNLPLFLLGGPMCYFVGDRSYELGARLQAEVFDISEGHEILDDYAVLTIPLYVESKEMDLRFLDRAHGAGDYALSLICPAGLLARETDSIEEELGERVPADLGRDLAVKVLAQRSQFEQNLALGAFKLESDVARFEPRGPGLVHVTVPVVELPGAAALHRYELRNGDAVLASHEFTASAGGDGRHVIEDDLALPEGTEYLNVRLMDARANVRSYTLEVAAPQR